jgi:glycosyltransferase involved in cell wall biosynthesis
MDYTPNVEAVCWFCREVWPRYRQEQPDARFRIVGRRPTPAVRSLGGSDGVIVTGSVPDVRPYIHGSICVAPLLVARGIQNKVLEALSCGAGVVASPQAVQGIQAIDGQELIVADGADSFADALCRLARTPSLAASLGQAGRRFVQARHAWPAAVRPLTEAMRSLISHSVGRTQVPSPV